MKTRPDLKLSSELQELYLQNKQWLSDILFLEDESRFFRNVVSRFFFVDADAACFKEAEQISVSLGVLETKRDQLKKLIIQHQQLLESLLEHPEKCIELGLIEESEKIKTEIRNLFASDVSFKKELYALTEQVIKKERAGHLLNK